MIIHMANLTLVYGLRLLPEGEVTEIQDATLKLSNGHEAHVTMHTIEGSREEIEAQLKQVAEVEHRSVQQTVLVAIEEYLSMRETAEILADPSALRGLAEARESEQSGDVVYGAEAARALLAERQR